MPAPEYYPVTFTQAQRKAVAEIAPELADRLKLDEKPQRTISFTLAELKAIHWLSADAQSHAGTARKRNALRHVTDRTAHAFDRPQGVGAIPI